MPESIQPVWDRESGLFYNKPTGQFLNISQAVPALKMSGGAIRDALGRFVPHEFLGGITRNQWTSGRSNYTVVQRSLAREVAETAVRNQDMLVCEFTYTYQKGEPQTLNIVMPKGQEYWVEVADERMANRIAGREIKSGEEIDFENDVEILSEDWSLTTWYGEGERIASDYMWFQGQVGG